MFASTPCYLSVFKKKSLSSESSCFMSMKKRIGRKKKEMKKGEKNLGARITKKYMNHEARRMGVSDRQAWIRDKWDDRVWWLESIDYFTSERWVQLLSQGILIWPGYIGLTEHSIFAGVRWRANSQSRLNINNQTPNAMCHPNDLLSIAIYHPPARPRYSETIDTLP